MRRRRADHGEQKSDARFQLGRHSLEGWVCVLVGAAWRGWIRNAPVDLLGPAAELRTYLSHSVAQRDHIVEALALESAQMLRRAACQLDPVFPENAHRVGMQRLRVAASADHLDMTCPLPQQCLRYR